MKLIKTELHHVAYTEKTLINKELVPMLLKAEKQMFTSGLYKNGPTMVETPLSTFGTSGEHLFKFYLPVNDKIDNNEEFSYIKHLVLDKVVSHRAAFDSGLADEMAKVKTFMAENGLKNTNDTLYLTFYPVLNELWVDIHIPFEEEG